MTKSTKKCSAKLNEILLFSETTTSAPYGEKLTALPPQPSKPKRRRRKKVRPINRQVFSKRYGISYARPVRIRRLRPFRGRFRGKNIHRGQLYLNRQRPRLPQEVLRRVQNSDAYMKSLRSSFDFNGIVALAGLWVVWNTFLVSIVPSDFLFDFVNNVGRSVGQGRSSSEPQVLSARQGRSGFSDFEKNVRDFKRIVRMLERKKTS